MAVVLFKVSFLQPHEVALAEIASVRVTQILISQRLTLQRLRFLSLFEPFCGHSLFSIPPPAQ